MVEPKSLPRNIEIPSRKTTHEHRWQAQPIKPAVNAVRVLRRDMINNIYKTLELGIEA